MEIVVGLSLTPSTIGCVLVDSGELGGATIAHDSFDVPRAMITPADSAPHAHYVTEAVSRVRAITAGYGVRAIGVTGSDDLSAEALLVLERLAESGCPHIVSVSPLQAIQAFAEGIARVIDSRITAVCVVEPRTVTVLVLDSGQGDTKTAVSNSITTDQDLIVWLSEVIAGAHRLVDNVVLLGSGAGLDAIARRLEAGMGIPVYAPSEARLALARGAALASTSNSAYKSISMSPVGSAGSVDKVSSALSASGPAPSQPGQLLSPAASLVMLVSAILIFVVCTSIVVGSALIPGMTTP